MGSRYTSAAPDARAARSSAVEPTVRPPGAMGGSSGMGGLGGGGRGGGRVGGASGLSEARQQPLQSHPMPLLRTSQAKDSLSSPQLCFWPQGLAHGSFPWPAATGTSTRASSTCNHLVLVLRGACSDEEPRAAGTHWHDAPFGTRSRRSWSHSSHSIIATAMPYPTALAALYPGVPNGSSAMPTSSLHQTNDAAAISTTASECVPPNEVADIQAAALLVTVTLAVASAAFMSAPIAGVAEEAVLAAAISAARRQALRWWVNWETTPVPAKFQGDSAAGGVTSTPEVITRLILLAY